MGGGDILTIAIWIILGLIVVVLVTGIFNMLKGGDFNRKHSNRLMRWRVILQGVAVILLGLLFLFKD